MTTGDHAGSGADSGSTPRPRGPRYSDRFFVRPDEALTADDRPREAERDPVPIEPVVTDDRSVVSTDRRGSLSGRAVRVALVATLVAGAAAGAFGIERWRAHERAVAARTSVELVAWTSVTSYVDDATVVLAVGYRNDGAYPVTVTGFHVESPRLEPSLPPEPVSVDPGDTAQQSVSLSVTCDAEAEESLGEQGWFELPELPPEMVLDVETVDGASVEHTVHAAIGSDLTNLVRYSCQNELFDPTFSDLYAQLYVFDPDALADHVRASVVFDLAPLERKTRILGVASSSPAYAVSLVGSGDMPPAQSSFVVEVTVADCALARTAQTGDMSITVSGALDESKIGQVRIEPTAELALALVRLTERVCS